MRWSWRWRRRRRRITGSPQSARVRINLIWEIPRWSLREKRKAGEKEKMETHSATIRFRRRRGFRRGSFDFSRGPSPRDQSRRDLEREEAPLWTARQCKYFRLNSDMIFINGDSLYVPWYYAPYSSASFPTRARRENDIRDNSID